MPEDPRTYRVRDGGMMRCCLKSLDLSMQQRMIERPEEVPLAVEGETLGCRYESNPDEPKMIYRDGAWEWVGPKRQ